MMDNPTGWQQMKERMRGTWMAGDFGKIAQYSVVLAEEFVARLGIRVGTAVLDVACGTGNTAIPAARAGARVRGVDIAPNLLEQARTRARDEGLHATFEEGDAEELPYGDGEFDLVISMFGAMFAPRPERVAAELTRVCRPGGQIAMANWTPESFAGKMFRLTAQHLPPPDGVAPPVLWGEADTVRERLSAGIARVETVRRKFEMTFPFPPGETAALFQMYFGPTQVAFAQLDEAKRGAFARDLEEMWTEYNEGGAEKTVIRNEYLEVIATRG